MKYEVRDIKLAAEGVKRIEWADRSMPVLSEIRKRFDRQPPADSQGRRGRPGGLRLQPPLHAG
jgi:S-adenosylhomocysteine hydrolase